MSNSKKNAVFEELSEGELSEICGGRLPDKSKDGKTNDESKESSDHQNNTHGKKPKKKKPYVGPKLGVFEF